MSEGTGNGDAATHPVGQQKHIRLGEQVGQVKAAPGQFGIRGVAGVPELPVRAQFVELGQGNDDVHVLGRLMLGFVGGESQRERGASVEGQFDRMIEMAVQGLQDEERIIHDE